MPAFDLIKDEHYLPAFERGMAEELGEYEAIATNPEAAAFENTIVAMERAGQMLGRTSRVFRAMGSAHTNDSIKELETLLAPVFSAHNDSIYLNTELFARIDLLYQARDDLGLDPESLRLLERYYIGFVRSGAKLSDDQKRRLRDINAERAELATAFRQNVLNEVNDSAIVVDSSNELAGFSASQIESAATAAEERGLEGKYVVTLRNTTQQPALTFLENRQLRQRIQEVSAARGSRGNEYDNREIVVRILALRAERANLLGYENHAAYILEDRTAGTIEAVAKMLGRLGPRAVAQARKEAADLQTLINESETEPFEIASWDWLYYTEILRKQRYNFDANQLKPYFEMNRVLEDGVFYFAERLYGLTFKEMPELPVYQEDVRVFEVFYDGEALGLFIFDPYARDSKRGGAWMNSYVSQSHLLDRKPVVANHLNVVKPPEGEPTLLTLDETNTMFHEFGHAVHGLLSNVKYPRFSGTAVPRDFVEYPSQVHEMWATWPEVLANYAVHYQTGEPIPQDLLDRVIAAETFNQGFARTEYLAASIVDQAWHKLTVDEIGQAEAVRDFEAKALVDSGMDFDLVPPRYSTTYFSHMMGGYSAGYYSYIWSEVLDADSVKWFHENGGLKRENGDHFRETLLSKGGSVDAMELFRNFRGAEPSIEPLLERLGFD
ncbi:MAG: M3 family metallopeptidase [Proteobacteria bacterium]|nr:M3 family metallopeptidase [Pseudomonadota bacterium]